MPDETFGSTGYEAYARSTGGKTFDGRDMPAWNDLPQNIRTAWCDAAAAIRVKGVIEYKPAMAANAAGQGFAHMGTPAVVVTTRGAALPNGAVPGDAPKGGGT